MLSVNYVAIVFIAFYFHLGFLFSRFLNLFGLVYHKIYSKKIKLSNCF